MAVDMETATLFSAAFRNKFPAGALLLVSDIPMIPEGVKTESSDVKITQNFAQNHVTFGIDSLRQLINESLTVKHLKF
jgi:AMP nucleosidase